MDLSERIKAIPGIDIFSPLRDEIEVEILMKSSPLPVGKIELTYDRSPAFQNLLRCQAPEFVTFLGRNREKKINTLFSVSWGTRWLNGKVVNCGYIGDFRTDLSRQSAILWRKSYAKILNEIVEQANSEQPFYFLTAILKKNKAALKNLVQSNKDLGLKYNLLKEVLMVNVFSSFSFKKKVSYSIRTANEKDKSNIFEFLKTNEQKKTFGFVFSNDTLDTWSFREKNWLHFDVCRFLIAEDLNKNIVAVTLPWDPSFAKRMTVTRASPKMTFALQFLKKLGFRFPTVGQHLKTIYLTHLNFAPSVDKAEIIRHFVKRTFKLFPEIHIVSYADFYQVVNQTGFFAQQKTPVFIYSVDLDHQKNKIVQPLLDLSFEMGLV